MATKRQPLNRPARYKLTREAVELFVLGERLAARRRTCTCDATDGRRCLECRAFISVFKRLHWGIFKLPGHTVALWEVRDGEPPLSMRGKCIADTWKPVLALRHELQAAATAMGLSHGDQAHADQP